MRLHSITLKDYRGITERHVDFDDHGITVIAGPNQSGKSSVIEAINLVLTEKATSTKMQ
ncbi:MAG: AAA family ATPase [Lawsonella clevelandensis]